MENHLQERVASAAFAFRGYNTTNLGRTGELLAHPLYGSVIERHLRAASEICAQITHKPVDLVERVRAGRESTLDTFGEDIGLICSVELAQMEILKNLFGVEYSRSRCAIGYSLGEITALVCGGVYEIEDVLRPLMTLAAESAELARDTTMGVVFSRGPALDFDAVERLCQELNREGRGIIAISSYLSPNTVLILGQGDTVDRFKARMHEVLEGQVHLRKNNERWPPLHTPLLWSKCIPNRAAIMMQTMAGGRTAPIPPVISLVTGQASYNDFNSREIINRWIDHPQKLWDVMVELLSSGIELVIHVGPDPNLIPATFKRLSDNVAAQMQRRSVKGLGLRTVSGMMRRPWLTKLLASRAALLRAPLVSHIILENWLLAQNL